MLLSPSGRIGREPFWVYTLALSFPVVLFEWSLSSSPDNEIVGTAYLIYLLAALVPNVMIQIKRWHDRGKSGWWVAINVIPLGSIWALIENGFLEGDAEANKYGPETNSKSDA